MIEAIREERKKLLERVHKLDAVINAFQEVCKHEMVHIGHDSHYDWYECKICGKSERE